MNKLKRIILLLTTLAIGVLLGYTADISFIRPTTEKEVEKVVEVDTGGVVELSDEQIPAVIETKNGDLEEVDVPTIEEVDGGEIKTDVVLNFGQGAWYDTSSPAAFAAATVGKCIDVDGWFGAQCVDLAAAFTLSYSETVWSTCRTGAAYGIWDCKDLNAGDDYVIITNPAEIQAGDWLVFSGGKYGHIGMARGPVVDGYVALLGQNQGGEFCANGGAATNTINISMKHFLGAFRPKGYIIPEPEPEAPDTGVVK